MTPPHWKKEQQKLRSLDQAKQDRKDGEDKWAKGDRLRASDQDRGRNTRRQQLRSRYDNFDAGDLRSRFEKGHQDSDAEDSSDDRKEKSKKKK